MGEHTITGEDNIRLYTAKVQLKALELELKGIRLGKRSVLSSIKSLYGLRGNKQRVYEGFKQLINYWESR